jgi:uncharacterized membrane protein (TIGR02234 family)
VPDRPAVRPAPERRPLWIVVLLLLLGAGGLYLSSRLTWSSAVTRTVLHGAVRTDVTGSQASPALVPLALLALAAIAAALAVGGWPRRALGVLVALAGVAAIALGVAGIGGVFGAHPAGYPTSQSLFGHLLPILAGLLVIGAGVVLIRAADRMPRLGGNYQTPAAARKVRDPDTELWQALSHGDDPTDTGVDTSTDVDTDTDGGHAAVRVEHVTEPGVDESAR